MIHICQYIERKNFTIIFYVSLPSPLLSRYDFFASKLNTTYHLFVLLCTLIRKLLRILKIIIPGWLSPEVHSLFSISFLCVDKGAHKPKAHMARPYDGFLSIKHA